MKISIVFLLVCFSYTLPAQTFYVNTGYPGLQVANTYKLKINPCDPFAEGDMLLPLPSCTPTSNGNSYDDMAIDKDGNIWYVSTTGDLYKMLLGDTTCSYIGDFTTGNGVVNALVADSAGDLYAVSNWTDTCKLLKYDAKGFHTIGILPKGIYSSGDLFFFKHRLFLLCYYGDSKNSFLTEIAIKDPSKSCYYMGLDSIVTFAAFTINENNKNRAFIVKSNTDDFLTSSLVEIDIPNKRILNATCYYPFFVRGATTFYGLTGDSSSCMKIPQGVTKVEGSSSIIVLNPCIDVIRLGNTLSLSPSEIKKATLFDLSGKEIVTYTSDDFPNQLSLSAVLNGLYILNVLFVNGTQSIQRVQKLQ